MNSSISRIEKGNLFFSKTGINHNQIMQEIKNGISCINSDLFENVFMSDPGFNIWSEEHTHGLYECVLETGHNSFIDLIPDLSGLKEYFNFYAKNEYNLSMYYNFNTDRLLIEISV